MPDVATHRVWNVGNPMCGPVNLRDEAFVWGCIAMVAATTGLAIWSGATGQWTHALVWAAIASLAGGVLYVRELPPLLGFLLALAAGVNGAGYTLNLWTEDTLFDEIVHAFTSFAGMSAIGWWLLQRDFAGPSQAALFAAVIGIGLTLGLVWEAFEWLIGIIGSRGDTLIDLAMDGLGAAAAAVLTCLLGRQRASWKATPGTSGWTADCPGRSTWREER